MKIALAEKNKKKIKSFSSVVLLAFMLAFYLPVASAAGGGVQQLSLNCDWQVAQKGKSDWIGATVPGNVHTDLLKAKKIPDAFFPR